MVRGKDHSSQLPGMTPAPYEAPPAQLSSVSLFIDNVLPSQMWVCTDGNGRTINPPDGRTPLRGPPADGVLRPR